MFHHKPIADLWRFQLRRGAGHDPAEGACLLDAVSWLEYGRLDDHPPCVCPAIAGYGRVLNDHLADDDCQRLRAYIPRLAGTVDKANKAARLEALRLHATTTLLPAWVDVAQPALASEASVLRDAKTRAEIDLALHRLYAASRSFSVAIVISVHNGQTAIQTGISNFLAAIPLRGLNGPSLEPHLVGPAIAGLDAMLAIGRQADPVSDPRIENAASRFARAGAPVLA